jgi:Uma2 family endonuclease
MSRPSDGLYQRWYSRFIGFRLANGQLAIMGDSIAAMSTQPLNLLTVEQYLEIERAAECRSEYLNGEIFAMAGGSVNHIVIASAAIVRIGQQLQGKPCTIAGSDLRVFCKPANILTYPDCVVFCGPRKYLDGQKDTLVDATVIVEVLSPSTKNYDRGEKFRYYRGLPSFVEYLLLAQDAIRAEHHVRQEDGSWLFREFNGPDSVIALKSIGCTLHLGDLYEHAEFEAA